VISSNLLVVLANVEMIRDNGWRGGCFAAGVKGVVVGSVE
jgi:hypothetical protein